MLSGETDGDPHTAIHFLVLLLFVFFLFFTHLYYLLILSSLWCRLLLKFDPSLAYRRTQSGSTVLHLAVANSNFQLVDFFLDTLDEEIIWAVNNGGSNALHLACKFGNVAMIDRLAKLHKADVNFRNEVEDTTCAELVCHNFDETMHVLATSGAKLEFKTATDLLGPKMKALFSVSKTLSVPKVRRTSSTDSTDNVSSCSGSSTGGTSSPYSVNMLRKSKGGVALVEEQANLVSNDGVASPPSTPTSRRKSSSYFPPSNASFLPPKDESSSAKKTKEQVKKDNAAKAKHKKISNSNSWIKSGASVDDEKIVKVSTALKKDMTISGQVVDEKEEEVEKKEDDGDVGKEESSAVPVEVEQHTVEEESSDAPLFLLVQGGKIPELEAELGVFPSITRDVNTIRGAGDGTSLLHVAAKSGSLDVAQYLVEGVGADVNALDSNQQSPLHYAVKAAQLILVRYLVKYCGAVLDTKDSNGHVALDLLSSSTSEDRDEIERIIQKSSKKAPEKRMKVTIPKFSPA
jgi:hypothetical protein